MKLYHIFKNYFPFQITEFKYPMFVSAQIKHCTFIENNKSWGCAESTSEGSGCRVVRSQSCRSPGCYIYGSDSEYRLHVVTALLKKNRT